MRWASLGFMAAMAVSGAARADESAYGVSFKDWWAICDNLRACSAYGFASEGAEAMGFLRIERGGAPADAPRVSIGTLGATAKSWRADVDGKPIRGDARIALEATEDSDIEVVTLGPAQAAAVLEGVLAGKALTLVGDGRPGPVISLAGSSAALRWVDDRQKRAGTTGALVAKGAKPMTDLPPEPPLIRPAEAVDQSGLPKSPPASVLALREGCHGDMNPGEEGWMPEAYRLSPDRLLWIVPCSSGAYNFVSDLFTTDAQGGAARMERVEYGDELTHSLMNPDYDPQRRVLTSFVKARGVGDCGHVNEWTWTGQRFELSHTTLMTECRGVLADNWPTLFVSRDR